MLLLTVRHTGVDPTVDQLLETDPRAHRAANRAINKAIDWLSGHVAREIAKDNQVPVRVIRTRRTFMHYSSDGRLSGSLWFGLNSIKAAYAGPLRQQRKGARAGAHLFEGGFLATMKNGHRGIFKRAGKARFPIVEQSVILFSEPDDYAHLVTDAEERLGTLLAQELNYEFNVKGGQGG